MGDADKCCRQCMGVKRSFGSCHRQASAEAPGLSVRACRYGYPRAQPFTISRVVSTYAHPSKVASQSKSTGAAPWLSARPKQRRDKSQAVPQGSLRSASLGEAGWQAGACERVCQPIMVRSGLESENLVCKIVSSEWVWQIEHPRTAKMM